MSQRALDHMQRMTGIAQTQWNEHLGSVADDTTALERKLGVRLGQWLADFGGTHLGEPIAIGDGLSADSGSVFADTTEFTADVT